MILIYQKWNSPVKILFKSLLLASTIYTLLIPNISFAEEEVDSLELSPEQLFSAVVTSVSKKPQKLWDSAAAVYVVTGEDIKRLGATSIAEALRIVPGVQVARNNNNGWTINVRGMNSALSNKLLVLFDGREVYDPLFSGVYWDIQDYVLEDIDRIEVIRGPGATLWGSNAVNGVINIITKKSSDTQGGVMNVISGNKENALMEMRYGNKMKNNGHYRVYGKSFFRDENETPYGTDANDEWKGYRTGFRTDWDKNEADSFNVQGDYYYNAAGGFGTVAHFSAPFSTNINQNILARGGNMLGTWSHKFSDDEKLDVKTYINFTERAQYLLVNRRVTFDADVQYEMPQKGRHKFIIGGKLRQSSDDLTFSELVTAFEQVRHDKTISGFIHDKMTLKPDKLFLTMGSKFEHNDYSGYEVQPSARLQWHPTDSQMLWGSVSYAVRTPSRLEHDLHIVSSAGRLSGNLITADLVSNAQFESEKLTAYEIGYRNKIKPNLTLDTTAFYNDYHDLLSIEAGALTDIYVGRNPTRLIWPFIYKNLTRAYTYGFETLLDWQATDKWNISTSYSFIDINEKGPSEIDEKVSPQGQFNIHSKLDIGKNIQFDNMLYYVSALPGYSVDDYWRFDTRLGWQATDTIELSLVGQNLLEDSHREFSSSTSIGATNVQRSIYGSVTWRF